MQHHRRPILLLTAAALLAAFTLHCQAFRTLDPADYQPDPTIGAAQLEDVELYWVGHATVLFKIKDKWFLTDPCFTEYLGGVVRRYVDVGIDVDKIPAADWVMISHTHYDHLDRPSLRMLSGSKQLLAPAGGVPYIPGGVFEEVHGVENWKSYTDADGVKVTAVPAQHFGGRLIFDNLWDGEPYHGYVVEYAGVTVFFAGDTGYNDTMFKEIGERFDVDIALIPVGPSGNKSGFGRSLGKIVHVDPYEAVDVFRDVRAKWMIPIHHSTFYRRGGDERAMIDDAIAKSGLADRILLLNIGEKVEFDVENERYALVNRDQQQLTLE